MFEGVEDGVEQFSGSGDDRLAGAMQCAASTGSHQPHTPCNLSTLQSTVSSPPRGGTLFVPSPYIDLAGTMR